MVAGPGKRRAPAKGSVDRQATARRRSLLEERFAQVFNSVPAGISISDPADGRLLDVNEEFARIFGYSREELIGRTTIELGLWLDVADRERLLGLVPTAGRLREVELKMRARSGETLVLRSSFDTSELDGKPLLIATFADVTARARAEDELRRSREELRSLARRLQSVREEECRRIAREIHDEVGQGLTALRLDASWLEAELPDASTEVRGRVAGMVQLARETMEAGHRIIVELRPPILDDLGLVPALEWHIERFAEHTGLHPRLSVSPPSLTVDRDLAVAVYRIVQEALTNVARHAQAAHVEVRLVREPPALTLEVRDDGRGMPARDGGKDQGFGLVGMRERAQTLGGNVAVDSAPGVGTTVRVTIPLPLQGVSESDT